MTGSVRRRSVVRRRPVPGPVKALAGVAAFVGVLAGMRRRLGHEPSRTRPWGRDWAVLERVDAPDYDQPHLNYMTRWRLLSTPWFGLYVHRINRPDPRPTLHDHPWPFVTLILRGAYTESRGYRATKEDTTGPIVLTLPEMWRAGSVHRMRKTDAHAITVVHRSPTWTFVVVGRRHPEPSWGYWDEAIYTPFDQHPHAAEFAAAKAARQGGAR